MHPKWRAPACYVGVALLCAVYLIVVPGVNLVDVAAGAGIGAAVMWAINEWETGKWNVTLSVQPAFAAAAGQPVPQYAGIAFQGVPTQMVPVMQPAGQAAPMQPVPMQYAHAQAMPQQAAPMQQAAAEVPVPPVAEVTALPTLAEPEPRHRVDAGAPTPSKMEKWEIDEKEPSWDPTALAETWAKLRAELSINRPSRPAVSPDLPRSAQFARTPDPKTQRPAGPTFLRQPAQKAAPAKPQTATGTSKPGNYTLGSYSQNGGSLLATYGTTGNGTAPRKTAGATEPARQPSSFLRTGALRPR